jgi:uncharacterized protein YpmS
MKKQTKQPRTPKVKGPRGPINWWKWATIIIVGILLGTGITVWTRVQAPVEQTTKVATVTSRGSVMHASFTKKELNRLIANYLQSYLKQGDVQYSLVIGNHAVVKGSFKFFGAKINFGLQCDPYVQTNGNILLKATKLNVGTLSVPISYVMGYVAKNYNLPDMVHLDSKANTIVLRLNQFDLGNGLHVKADRIDLTNDEIDLTGYLAK